MISFSPLLAFSSFKFLTKSNAVKHLIYVFLSPVSSSVIKAFIADTIELYIYLSEKMMTGYKD